MALATVFALIVLSIFAIQANKPPVYKTLAQYQGQQLNWSTCLETFTCATMYVPIDYTNLKTGSFNISLLKSAALLPKKRLGAIVVNPGGPGASGVTYAYNAEYILSPDILDRYDIVGFDPRGVTRSSPIACLDAAQTDANYASDSKPNSAAEFNKAIVDSKDFVKKCLAKTKHLMHYSTAEAARDMDILRSALHEEKFNYLGKSYGTYLGTLYAQFFPTKVGRMVLDGAIDPNATIFEQNLSQAIGFERALEAFIIDCQGKANCPLPKTISAAKAAITELFNATAKKPLHTKKKQNEKIQRVVTQSLAVLGTASALYDNESGWPQLRTALVQAKLGYGDEFLALADSYTGRDAKGKYPTNAFDSGAVIGCLDWHDSRTIAEMHADVAVFTKAAPIFGPYLSYTGLTCKYFPPAPKDALTRTTNKITSITTAPIIVIGTTRDPATPYKWAVGLNKIFLGSRLISLDADGHTGQGRGSTCVDGAIDAYFINGALPAKNLACSL